MGRLFRFLSLIVALGLGFGIGAGYSWLKGQTNFTLPTNTTTDLIPPELVDLINPAKPQRPSVEFKITGIVDILPELKSHIQESDTLLIIVTRPGGVEPLALKKIHPVNFPFLYTIGPEDQVQSTLALDSPAEVNVSFRVGDLLGKPSGAAVKFPARDLQVLIDRVADDDRVVK